MCINYFSIKSDQKTFLLCTETIIRQVKDIKRMVDEFSSFSRMPEPDFKEVNLTELCTQSIFMERNRFPDIDYIINTKEPKIEMTKILENPRNIWGKLKETTLGKSKEIWANTKDNPWESIEQIQGKSGKHP